VEDFLPPAYFSMVHFATGALVFLCFLIGLHVLLNGSFLNRNPQDEPSV
jgi:succinate dehydrogenase/fumarate reductase cytochrome b subunit